MIFLTTVKDAILQSVAAKKIRTITAVLFGPNDAKNQPECSPAGYDGSPIAGLTALYVKTSKKGAAVFVGYVNANQIAAPGEARLYSTDSGGTEQIRLWLRNNGKINIGGTGSIDNTNHSVQYEALNLAITNYLAIQNTAITTAFTSIGATYVAPPPIDLTLAKELTILVP